MAVTKKSKTKKNVSFARVYINAGYNNTMLVATENNGDVVAWHSSGAAGFKNTKKSSPHAATEATNEFVAKLKAMGVKTGELILKGLAPGRDAAIKVLQYSGIQFDKIYDKTGHAFNGTKPPKQRRV